MRLRGEFLRRREHFFNSSGHAVHGNRALLEYLPLHSRNYTVASLDCSLGVIQLEWGRYL